MLPGGQLRRAFGAATLSVVVVLVCFARTSDAANRPASAPYPPATAASIAPTTAPEVAATRARPLTLAYFYIWFDPSSWNRAKRDQPLIGRYSSSDRNVMEQQVRMAQAAGIEGFIVSWKSTPTLDARLSLLADVAQEHDFKLVVIYEGLDFHRRPIPVGQVAADLDTFIQRYASRSPFQLFAKPPVILSGSWAFSRDAIAQLGQARRKRILLLASERNTTGIDRLNGLIDGDAYYWSSVNPATYPHYQEKLDQLGAAVHAEGGLWVAPAAAGFDARLVGGSTTVGRDSGQTLRTEFTAASRSNPDAIGLISWNEFSENSEIEPSRNYGTQSLETLAPLLGGVPPSLASGGLDSSEPGSRGSGWEQVAALGVLVLVTVAAAAAMIRRHRRGTRTPTTSWAVAEGGSGEWRPF